MATTVNVQVYVLHIYMVKTVAECVHSYAEQFQNHFFKYPSFPFWWLPLETLCVSRFSVRNRTW